MNRQNQVGKLYYLIKWIPNPNGITRNMVETKTVVMYLGIEENEYFVLLEPDGVIRSYYAWKVLLEEIEQPLL